MLSNVTCELGDLDLILELLLEASKEYLTLRRLESVHDVGNGTDIISNRKENELPIDEFTVIHTVLLCLAVVQEGVQLDAV